MTVSKYSERLQIATVFGSGNLDSSKSINPIVVANAAMLLQFWEQVTSWQREIKFIRYLVVQAGLKIDPSYLYQRGPVNRSISAVYLIFIFCFPIGPVPELDIIKIPIQQHPITVRGKLQKPHYYDRA